MWSSSILSWKASKSSRTFACMIQSHQILKAVTMIPMSIWLDRSRRAMSLCEFVGSIVLRSKIQKNGTRHNSLTLWVIGLFRSEKLRRKIQNRKTCRVRAFSIQLCWPSTRKSQFMNLLQKSSKKLEKWTILTNKKSNTPCLQSATATRCSKPAKAKANLAASFSSHMTRSSL